MIRLTVIAGTFCALAAGCNNGAERLATTRTLDSLTGAISSWMASFNHTDSLALRGEMERCVVYRVFVKEHVHDTLPREEGETLRDFLAAEAQLTTYEPNRVALLARARLVTSQLSRLANDARNGAPSAQLSQGMQQEKLEAERVIHSGDEQLRTLAAARATISRTMPVVESIIRRHNSGELPAKEVN